MNVTLPVPAVLRPRPPGAPVNAVATNPLVCVIPLARKLQVPGPVSPAGTLIASIVNDLPTLLVFGVADRSVAVMWSVCAAAFSVLTGTLALQRLSVPCLAVMALPLSTFTETDLTPLGDATSMVTGSVCAEPETCCAGVGVRRTTDGPVAALGASATPRNSVPVGASASLVAAPGNDAALEPAASVRVYSAGGVVAAIETSSLVATAVSPRTPSRATRPSCCHEPLVNVYFSIAPAWSAKSAR